MGKYEIYKADGMYYADRVFGDDDRDKHVELGGFPEYSELLLNLIDKIENNFNFRGTLISFRKSSEMIPDFPHRVLTRLVIDEHTKLLRIKKAMKGK
ncbi:MAG: hypothetical protein Q7S33_00245 [Nanoarchaeota archaeon]|nr:hypothetical protein [Nanoarchaeota archaeon]